MAEGIRDSYLNFFPLTVTFGADSSVLATNAHNTSMGNSTMVAWRIHTIEWMPNRWPVTAPGHWFTLVISTRKALASLPTIIDMGVIGSARFGWDYAVNGGGHWVQPITQTFLPPILIASANLSLYAQGNASDAANNSQIQYVRLGYTMVPLNAAAYQELFQTWNFSN